MTGRFQIPAYLQHASAAQLRELLTVTPEPVLVSPTAGRTSRRFKGTRDQARVDMALFMVKEQARALARLEADVAHARTALDALIVEAITQGATTTETSIAGKISRVTIAKILKSRPANPSPGKPGRPAKR